MREEGTGGRGHGTGVYARRFLIVPTAYRPEPMLDFIGVDTLLAELTLALGSALILGNGLAFYKASRGEKPEGAEAGSEFRTGRALFLIGAGALMTAWGIASIVSR